MESKNSSTILKCFIKRYLPVAVLILVVSIVVLYSQRTQYFDMVRSHEVNLIKGDYNTLSSWLESGVEDVVVLAGLVEESMRGTGKFSDKCSDIAKIFSIFGMERKNCVQIRYLSPQGKELVRVNIEQGTVHVVEKESLQDKSGRPYVQDGIKLSDGIYVSAFNLNKEFGKITVPHTPVLRFMKKVFRKNGEILGVVVVNISGHEILNTFKKSSRESFGHIFFVNGQGGWIVGPDESYDWRFLFGDKDGFFKDRFPEEWALIAGKLSGQFSATNGLYTFTSLEENNFFSSFRHKVILKEGWKIVSRVKESNLTAPLSNITLFLVVFLYLLSGFLFWRNTVALVKGEEVSAALRESEKRFMDVADAAGEFIWETGPDGCFVFVTGRAEDILGYSAEELIGRSPFDFVDEESSWEVRKEFLDAAHDGKSFSGLVFKFVNREGRKLWLEFNGVPVFDAEGVVTGFRGATSDISVQQRAMQSLQDREDMLQSISDSVQDALILMDENGLVHFWNPAAEKIFGYSTGDMIGESLQCCITAEDNTDMIEDEKGAGVEDLFANYGSFTINVRRKNGTLFPAEVLLSPLRKDGKWWVVGTIRDVTERKEAEDKLRKLATTDPLTGLSNRRFFMESAEEALQRALRYERELSLLMMDIDFFKNVNDTYGHDAGDDVLKGLASAGLKILRNIDVFGRIGGEEFSILLPDTGLEGGKLVAERLRKEIETSRMYTRSGELSITVSVGVACLNEKTRSLEHLLKAADIGLYTAKHAGRNRVEVQLSPDGTVDS